MSKKKNEKLKNVKIDISADDAEKIISRVSKKKTSLKINTAELAENLNSASTQYFMHILNVQNPTPLQVQTELKKVNATLEKLTQNLGILVNIETKKKIRGLRGQGIEKLARSQNITKDEKEALFINAENLGFGEDEQKQVLTFNTAFRGLEHAAQYSNVRDTSDPFGNYVLSFYRHVVVMKEISEQAMQSSLNLQPPNKATYTAEQWLIEELSSLYETYFEADFGLAKHPEGGKHDSPGIRFIKGSIKAMGLEKDISVDGDAIAGHISRMRSRKKKRLNQLIRTATDSKKT